MYVYDEDNDVGSGKRWERRGMSEDDGHFGIALKIVWFIL